MYEDILEKIQQDIEDGKYLDPVEELNRRIETEEDELDILFDVDLIEDMGSK